MKLKPKYTQRKELNMFKELPEEMQKIYDIIEPYFDGAALRDDAPEEIKKLHRQLCEMAIKLGQ